MSKNINIESNFYKARNKPNVSDNAKWHQGVFLPKHPEKWITKENIFRSSWEQSFMNYLDMNPAIVQIGSEPIKIPYLNPVKNLEYCIKNNLDPKDRRFWAKANYWCDFFFVAKQNDGSLKKFFVEIKPYCQTVRPKPLNESAMLKDKKKFNREAQTYLVNEQKWLSAKKFCEDHNCSFLIITERSLEKMGLL